MKIRSENSVNLVTSRELRPGIHRKTLVYDDKQMLCHFFLEKGARLELHSHEAAQVGYVISGKVEFFRNDGSSFLAGTGSSYLFQSWEEHGSIVHEDTCFVEFFSPSRPEYIDDGPDGVNPAKLERA